MIMESPKKIFYFLLVINVALFIGLLIKNGKDNQPGKGARQTSALIQNSSVEELEEFVNEYPEDPSVPAAKQRIKDLRNKEPSTTVPAASYTSLQTGAQPYAQYYGYNRAYDPDVPLSCIQVTSSVDQDVIVIVKYNNADGRVAGHVYIKSGQTGAIYVTPGYTYQVFFYYGNGWNPDKEMNGNVKGGFMSNESVSKDPKPQHFSFNQSYDEVTWDGGVEYNLNKVRNGNFRTQSCSKNDVF